MKKTNDAGFSREKLNKRITEIDLLRGICVFLMVFDHFMFDLWGLMPELFLRFPEPNGFWAWAVKVANLYWIWGVRVAVRNVVVFCFLALTGISCSFSRNNLKRGVMLFGVALLVTAGTFAVGEITGDMDTLISFGILHLISLSILFVALIGVITQNKWVYLAISAIMITFGAFFLKEKPVSIYSGDFAELFFKQTLGLVLLGPDSYSFFFYGGQVVFGVFLGKVLYPERKPLLFVKGYKNNFVTFTGRHSLIVYVAHQIILPLLLSLILLMCGYKLAI